MFELAFIVGINIYLEGGRNKIHKITCEGVFEFELSIVSMYHLYVPSVFEFFGERVFPDACWKRSGQEKAEKKQRRFRDDTPYLLPYLPTLIISSRSDDKTVKIEIGY
jgi:hypothetical protein